MFKTENEIFSQYAALKKTYDYLTKRSSDIKSFFRRKQYKNITFTGCGSSYSLCKSAEQSLKMRMDIKVNSIAAGDLLMNFSQYRNAVKDALIVAPSRSGSTSEVILAVKRAKEEFDTGCVCISAKNDSELSRIADFNIEIPWAFDESVCQTRTVTNLYLTNLFLVGALCEDESLINEMKAAVECGDEFIEKHKGVLENISRLTWGNAVVLADAELEGIAEEGALAFKEICQLHSNYYHILDVRHGPMVLINGRTLVILETSSNRGAYQQELINDLGKKGAIIVTVGAKPGKTCDTQYHVEARSYQNYAVSGIPFIFVPQALAFYKAREKGINPDEPQGLDPWIKL